MPYRDDEMAQKDARISELESELKEKKFKVSELMELTTKRKARKKMKDKTKELFTGMPAKITGLVLAVIIYFFVGGMTYTYLSSNDTDPDDKWHSSMGAVVWPVALPASFGSRLLEEEPKK
jgi:hypothetical protein